MGFLKPFRSFANSYFGDYLQCLLETGELPRFGAFASDNANNTASGNICDTSFEPFTLSMGRPATSGPVYFPELSPVPSSSVSGSKKVTYPLRLSDSSHRGSGGMGSGTRGIGGSGSHKLSLGGQAKSKKSGGKKKSTDSFQGDSDLSFGQNKRTKRKKIIVIVKKGKNQEKEKRKVEFHKKAQMQKGNQEGIKKKKIKMKLNKRKVASEKDPGFSFGRLFKIFLLLLLFIGFFILIASQALKFVKSYEK